MIKVTEENYFSPEVRAMFMSSTQLKAWQTCPACAFATYEKKTYSVPKKDCWGMGSLIDAYLLEPSAIDGVLKRYHNLFYTAKGSVSASFKRAMQVIEFAKKNPFLMQAIERSIKQKIYQFEFCGVWWIAKIDFFDVENNFLWDLKTTGKDIFGEEWVQRLGRRGNFIAVQNYIQQMAIYKQAIKDNEGIECKVGIAGLQIPSKVDGRCDIQFFPFSDSTIEAMDSIVLERIETDIAWIEKMKKGDIAIPKCQQCDYCRSSRETKQDFFTPYEER